MNEQLTVNFTLAEFLTSVGAAEAFKKFPTNKQSSVYTNILHLAQRLQTVRDFLGCPLIITSGLRTEERNDQLPGHAGHSTHLDGRGCDFSLPEEYTSKARVLLSNWSGGYHYYPEDHHFHVDTRPERFRW